MNIPPGSFLSPSEKAAVVGGNVLTSQRVTDVVFKCFEACAASQGDCNNLTFGYGGNYGKGGAGDSGKEEKGFGYYETIAGGSGAGKTWEGTSGVHTHMTNTRITDAEVFERRYPVILRRFELRKGSGGVGMHKGGDGVIRDIEFRIPVQVSILSERRVYRPYGLHGGGDAMCGKNIWVRKVKKNKKLGAGGEREGKRRDDAEEEKEQTEWEERHVSMGAKNTASMQPGERIIVMTPGGGAYGPAGGEKKVEKKKDDQQSWTKGSVASRTAEWESSS